MNASPEVINAILAAAQIGLLTGIFWRMGGFSKLAAMLEDRVKDHESRLRHLEGQGG